MLCSATVLITRYSHVLPASRILTHSVVPFALKYVVNTMAALEIDLEDMTSTTLLVGTSHVVYHWNIIVHGPFS